MCKGVFLNWEERCQVKGGVWHWVGAQFWFCCSWEVRGLGPLQGILQDSSELGRAEASLAQE